MLVVHDDRFGPENQQKVVKQPANCAVESHSMYDLAPDIIGHEAFIGSIKFFGRVKIPLGTHSEPPGAGYLCVMSQLKQTYQGFLV